MTRKKRRKKPAKSAARGSPKKPRTRPKLERRELKLDELQAILERAKSTPLTTQDHETLKAAVDTLAILTREIEAKGVSIQRLRRLLFGPSTEKTSDVLGDDANDADSSGTPDTDADTDAADKTKKKKRKGHGRNGADAYRSADRVAVSHASLDRGDPCPECEKGKVYPQPNPAVLVRVTGMAPLRATVYELERYRCNLCGEVFTARSPPDVGQAKYDESAVSMIGLLKYGCGLPFNRIEKLQKNLGIPMPKSTQWEVVHHAATRIVPACDELVRQAAQGEVLHNDDTTMKILELSGQARQEAMSESESDERTGVFTSGIVSTTDERRIALFFTGGKHAGENLADVLKKRAAELSPPIQMCDALSRNMAGEFDSILAHCIAHARRRFVDVADSFPEECRHVLETLREVYKNDAAARKDEMSNEDRLRLHQEKSGPLMEGLAKWLEDQLEQRKVEPNSSLGDAINYMRKHWNELTLFLREPGAPLDNNLCERVLKKAILHRKNAMFYKTKNGARVGDLFMTLIHTAELTGVDPFQYLVELQRHHEALSENPGEWMPWNYEDTLSRVTRPAG